MHQHNACEEVALHSFDVGFLIIVLHSADRACLLLAFVSLESLETLKTLLVKHVTAAQNGLFLETQVLITYWAGFLIVESLERRNFYLLPFSLAERQLRLLN